MNESKILLIDDEPVHLNMIMETFSEAGEPYEVIKTLDPNTALKLARDHQPDLIVTDWDMPKMNGIDLIRRLKADDETRDIPVIMCTGVMTTSANLRMALDAGAVDYLRKPIDAVELISRTKSMLKLSRSFKQIKKHEIELMEKTQQLEQKQTDLQEALNNIDTLRGCLPICAKCKKIRDDEGFWQQVESYISQHSLAVFSHGLCPVCVKDLYPKLYKKLYTDSGEDANAD